MNEARDEVVDVARTVLLPALVELEGRVRAMAPTQVSPAEVRVVALAVARVVLDELEPGRPAEVVEVRAVDGGLVRVLSVGAEVELETSRAGHPSGRGDVATSGRGEVSTSGRGR